MPVQARRSQTICEARHLVHGLGCFPGGDCRECGLQASGGQRGEDGFGVQRGDIFIGDDRADRAGFGERQPLNDLAATLQKAVADVDMIGTDGRADFQGAGHDQSRRLMLRPASGPPGNSKQTHWPPYSTWMTAGCVPGLAMLNRVPPSGISRQSNKQA